MPSPFPGMDPYLEGSIWPNVHTTMASDITRYIARRLGPGYSVIVSERFRSDSPGDIEISSRSAVPDVAIRQEFPWPMSTETSASRITAPLQLATMMEVEREPQFSIEIVDSKGRDLITAIEILSPSNKRGKDRREYLDKRSYVLRSSAHLLEIDLLRTGHRLPMIEKLPDAPYFIFLSRAGLRPTTEVWPMALREPLPPIPVPLKKGDDDISLDLQRVFSEAYDDYKYFTSVNYNLPPEIPLQGDDALWAAERIKQHQQ